VKMTAISGGLKYFFPQAIMFFFCLIRIRWQFLWPCNNYNRHIGVWRIEQYLDSRCVLVVDFTGICLSKLRKVLNTCKSVKICLYPTRNLNQDLPQQKSSLTFVQDLTYLVQYCVDRLSTDLTNSVWEFRMILKITRPGKIDLGVRN
jgi:hypothetical protein